MRYTIEGFSQVEAIKFRRTEIVNDKPKEVALDCTDLVILRWFVDFWPNMMKVEIGGKQYAWLSYKALIEDMPLIGIKKGMLALRLKKLVSFGILSHQTIKSGGTFSYYGFGSEYARLIDTNHTQQSSDPAQDFSEGVPNKLDTHQQKISDQIDSSTKDPSTRKPNICNPTIEQVKAHVREKGYHFDAQHFFDYYEASGWHFANGKPVKSWKQCCVTWERNWKRNESTDRRSQYTEQQNAEFDLYSFSPDQIVQL